MSSPPFGPSSSADGEEETEEQKRDREQCLDLMHGAHLPMDSVCYAFAYGSGAIQQQGERRSEKMVDLILVCNDTKRFHRNNMLVNPAHYSALFRYLNRPLINRFQRGHFPFPEGARVFYNTMVPSRGRLIKYGIVHAHDLLADLLGWHWLYVAGRLHKPVLDVFYNANLESMGNENEVIANGCRPAVCTPDEGKWRLSEAIAQNRWMATQAALLMSPPNLTMEELLQQIASLSYRGDVRMGWAEDRLKIEKLVAGSHHRLRQIYLPMLKGDPWVHLSGDRIEQDCSDAAVFERLQILPSPVLRRLRQQANCQQNLWQRLSTSFAQPADDNSIAIGEAQDELSQFLLANRRDLPQRLDSTLQAIVRRSSWQQSMRNALTAGIGRSFSYILPKLRKGLRF